MEGKWPVGTDVSINDLPCCGAYTCVLVAFIVPFSGPTCPGASSDLVETAKTLTHTYTTVCLSLNTSTTHNPIRLQN